MRRSLAALGARRIALVSPYPEGLSQAGYAYWRAAGIELATIVRVDERLSDTHAIYELTSADALTALREVSRASVDALVAAGTGMPTLAALRTLRTEVNVAALSSNLCLAHELLRLAAPELAPASASEMLSDC